MISLSFFAIQLSVDELKNNLENEKEKLDALVSHHSRNIGMCHHLSENIQSLLIRSAQSFLP